MKPMEATTVPHEDGESHDIEAPTVEPAMAKRHKLACIRRASLYYCTKA